MKTLTLKIEGTCPLLQHDDKLLNHFSEEARRFKMLSARKPKDESTVKEMCRIEWHAALYHTPQKGYYIKAEAFEGAFHAAAKSEKSGKLFKEAVRIPQDPALHFPDEGLTPDELFEREEYLHYAAVKVQNRKIFRCRPIFRQWHCTVELCYDEERMDAAALRRIADYAGRFVGICDHRPKYGRFTATEAGQP